MQDSRGNTASVCTLPLRHHALRSAILPNHKVKGEPEIATHCIMTTKENKIESNENNERNQSQKQDRKYTPENSSVWAPEGLALVNCLDWNGYNIPLAHGNCPSPSSFLVKVSRAALSRCYRFIQCTVAVQETTLQWDFVLIAHAHAHRTRYGRVYTQAFANDPVEVFATRHALCELRKVVVLCLRHRFRCIGGKCVQDVPQFILRFRILGQCV